MIEDLAESVGWKGDCGDSAAQPPVESIGKLQMDTENEELRKRSVDLYISLTKFVHVEWDADALKESIRDLRDLLRDPISIMGESTNNVFNEETRDELNRLFQEVSIWSTTTTSLSTRCINLRRNIAALMGSGVSEPGDVGIPYSYGDADLSIALGDQSVTSLITDRGRTWWNTIVRPMNHCAYLLNRASSDLFKLLQEGQGYKLVNDSTELMEIVMAMREWSTQTRDLSSSFEGFRPRITALNSALNSRGGGI